MYDRIYKKNTQATGVPKRAHNHALSSAIAHMELGVLLNDEKLFRKAFKLLSIESHFPAPHF